jgi:hypothetical protein
MTERQQRQGPEVAVKPVGVNPNYAAFQIAKALTTSEEHGDPETRKRAKEKIAKWEAVLRSILTGSVKFGSRTPVASVPMWATIEVVTGGFATGALLAGGPLQKHEKDLLGDLTEVPVGEERAALNTHFLTDVGLAQLREWLRTGCYDLAVPEEGALMVVAWLVENRYTEDARALVDEISPYFPMLRFYPIPMNMPRRFGSRVHVQDVGATIEDIRRIRPNSRVLAQKEAVQIWASLQDRIVALFLETVRNDWPCQNYPDGWSDRALSLLGEYSELRKEHRSCGKSERANGHCAQLRELLSKCARKPQMLSGREVGRIRHILNRHVEKWGAPDSEKCAEARRRQLADVSAPMHHVIAGVVVSRLEALPKGDGLDDVSQLNATVTDREAIHAGVPEGVAIPPSICRKVERCLNETMEVLVQRGLITSGEAIARILPQTTAGLQAAGIPDPALRQLDAAIYRAFRHRRSVLLLNLEKQVQIEELPWVAAIDRFRTKQLSSQELARQALEEISVVALTSFPHAILPNKLLQELRALVTSAGLDIPLVDELAVDIFMGQFSDKFVESARRAGDLLKGSLYATYYGIDYEELQKIPTAGEAVARTWFWQKQPVSAVGFAQVCAARAGVSLGTWDPATNGMIVEQQQILTTQNLAALFVGLNLVQALGGQLDVMARECFQWICKRHQMKVANWHARQITVKNTAYAWRQMIFFLALLPDSGVADFLRWAEAHLDAQAKEFQNRFRPALRGLVLAADGRSIDGDSAKGAKAYRFVGWSKTRHWLLADTQDQ